MINYIILENLIEIYLKLKIFISLILNIFINFSYFLL